MCETSQWCKSSQILNPQPPQNLLNASTKNTATTQIFEIHEIKHNSYKKKMNSLFRIAVPGKHSGNETSSQEPRFLWQCKTPTPFGASPILLQTSTRTWSTKICLCYSIITNIKTINNNNITQNSTSPILIAY